MILHGLVLLTLSATLGAPNPTTAQRLVGTWVSTKGQGGDLVTASVTFDKDGRMNNRITSKAGVRMRIGTYKLEMDQLIVTLEEDGKIGTETTIIKELTDNTLIIVDGQVTSVFKRKM